MNPVKEKNIVLVLYSVFYLLHYCFRCKERGCLACFNAPGKLRRHQKRHDKGKGICKGCCDQNAEMQNFVIL